jgi:hypothetical protein
VAAAIFGHACPGERVIRDGDGVALLADARCRSPALVVMIVDRRRPGKRPSVPATLRRSTVDGQPVWTGMLM